MAGPYYVDIGTIAAFNTRDGLSSGACWYGLAGLQHAFNTAVAGEIVYVSGSSVVISFRSCPYDANTGDLTNGEAVTWTGGAGVVVFSGAMASPVKIELTSGTAPVDGTVITGSTSGSTITAHTPQAATGISINVNGGSYNTGYIKFIGLSTSWLRNGTPVVYMPLSTAGTAFSIGKPMLWFENFYVVSVNGYGFSAGSSAYGVVLVNCTTQQCVNTGFYVYDCAGAFLYRCVSDTCGGHGFSGNNAVRLRTIGCVAYNNTLTGFYRIPTMLGCISAKNGDEGIKEPPLAGLLVNNVVEDHLAMGVLFAAGTSTYFSLLVGNRITNSDGYAAIDCMDEPVSDMFTYMEGNLTAPFDIIGTTVYNNIDPEGANVDSDGREQGDTNEGYIDLTAGSEDYNLRTDATMRRIAVTLPVID